MSSTIKKLAVVLAALTLVGCGGGGGGSGGGGINLTPPAPPADITTIAVDHFAEISTTPITGAANIQSTAQTPAITSVSSPQANQIAIGGTTYTFDTSIDSGGAIDQARTLLVGNSDTLDFGYSYARITVISIGTELGAESFNTNEVAFVQTSENPTAISNLPTQSSVRYTGHAVGLDILDDGAGSAFNANVYVNPENPDAVAESNYGTFALTVDFANPSGRIRGNVAFSDRTHAGRIAGRRGTGNSANIFTGSYISENNRITGTANIIGSFYGPNAAELSAIGRGDLTSEFGTLTNVIGFIGRRQ